MRTVGFPHVVVNTPELPWPMRIASLSEFDEVTATLPSMSRLRAGVAAELAAYQARWDHADQALGYSSALSQEELALEEEARLAEALLVTDASSIAGIVAKLDAVIALGATSHRCSEFPWPQLRRVRSELRRLAQVPARDRPSGR